MAKNLLVPYLIELMMITFDKVVKRYPGGHEALSQVSFHLAQGDMAFLTGHSGAGKSTLLKLIALIERPGSGQIQVNGHELSTVKKRHIPSFRREMGVIFQEPHLLKDKTIFDNVALPLIIAGHSGSAIGKRVRASLDLVGLLSKEKMYPQQLSGGEQQRIGVARAVVHKPQVLLADEPTGNLDPALSKDVMKLFSQLNDVGVTVLIATHDLGLIADLQYPILTLKAGQLC